MTKRAAPEAITDIDVYETANETLDLNSLQLDPGELVIKLEEVALSDIRVRRFSTSRALREDLWVAEGWTTFALPLHRHFRAHWCGAEVPGEIMGILRSGPTHEVVTPPGWDCIEIDVRDELLDREAVIPTALFERARDPHRAQLALTPGFADRLRTHLIETHGQALGRRAGATASSADTLLRLGLLDALASAVDHSKAAGNPGGSLGIAVQSNRYRLVRRACACLDAHLDDCPTISSVADELGVDTRTLQRAFLSTLGVTPKQYLLAKKLDMAKRELRRLGHRTTVTEVAHRFGFNSSSRFAEQYRRQFGDAPSSAMRIAP